MKRQITHQPAQLRMETRRPTVFVVINNVSVLTDLYKYLREEFNQRFTILTFKTMNETVTHLNKKPDIVVLDNAMENENISEFQELVENKCEVIFDTDKGMITQSHLSVNVKAGAISKEKFDKLITEAKDTCSISKSIKAKITYEAKLSTT